MKKTALMIGAVALTLGTLAFADEGHEGQDPSVVARKSHMQLYAHNLGILGGMAQGKIDYDAQAAQNAADNMVALAGMEQGTYWPEGTAEGTKALPAIWENLDDFLDKEDGLHTASLAAAEVAGTDLESLQGAMAGLGGACSACHREYRAR